MWCKNHALYLIRLSNQHNDDVGPNSLRYWGRFIREYIECGGHDCAPSELEANAGKDILKIGL